MERRAVQRLRAFAEIQCRSGGRTERVVVTDLSAQGCMLQSNSRFVEPGDGILLHISNRIAIEGKVIWQQGRRAGVSFFEQLHQVVVTHLGFSDETAELNHELGRDPFGRPLLGARGPNRRFL